MSELHRKALLHPGNPGLVVGQDGVMQCMYGAGMKLIGEHTEGVQLSYMLHCELHTRYCTPHTICSADDLCCKICTPPLAPVGGKRKGLTALERAFLVGLTAKGLGAEIAVEVRLPFWHGRIDFMHKRTRVLIQVDGPHHFRGNAYGLLSKKYAELDMRMCAAVWEAKGVVVRVPFLDVEGGRGAALAAAVIDQMDSGLRGPLVVLSSHYKPPLLHEPPKAMQHLQLHRSLHDLLSPARLVTDAGNNLWFTPTAMK